MKPTTIEQAQVLLKGVRKQQRELVIKSRELRDFITAKGGNTSPYTDTSKRDKAIYKEWRKGKSFTELGKTYNLSSTRISSICRRQG